MAGMVLVVAEGNITGDDGHGEVYAAPIAQTATQPERCGLVAALEQFADDSNWCYDTCNISRDVAKDALASYRPTQGGDA